MESYEYDVAQGNFSHRELVKAGGKKGPLNEVALAIAEARSEKLKGHDNVGIEHLIGLLRYEADRMETAYIQALEDEVQRKEQMAEEELLDEYIAKRAEEYGEQSDE